MRNLTSIVSLTILLVSSQAKASPDQGAGSVFKHLAPEAAVMSAIAAPYAARDLYAAFKNWKLKLSVTRDPNSNVTDHLLIYSNKMIERLKKGDSIELHAKKGSTELFVLHYDAQEFNKFYEEEQRLGKVSPGEAAQRALHRMNRDKLMGFSHIDTPVSVKMIAVKASTKTQMPKAEPINVEAENLAKLESRLAELQGKIDQLSGSRISSGKIASHVETTSDGEFKSSRFYRKAGKVVGVLGAFPLVDAMISDKKAKDMSDLSGAYGISTDGSHSTSAR